MPWHGRHRIVDPVDFYHSCSDSRYSADSKIFSTQKHIFHRKGYTEDTKIRSSWNFFKLILARLYPFEH